MAAVEGGVAARMVSMARDAVKAKAMEMDIHKQERAMQPTVTMRQLEKRPATKHIQTETKEVVILPYMVGRSLPPKAEGNRRQIKMPLAVEANTEIMTPIRFLGGENRNWRKDS